MSYDKVQSLSIVKRKDGWTYKGRFAASNVVPQYYESGESTTRWKSREEVDLEVSWHFFNGNLQGGRTEWSVRDDIASFLVGRAAVKPIPYESRKDDDSHRYGWRCGIMEEIIFPAARDLYALWKADKKRYAIVDSGGGFVRKIVNTKNGTTIQRQSQPTFWDGKTMIMMLSKIALNPDGYRYKFRCISESSFTDVLETESKDNPSLYPYTVASTCYDNATPLFQTEWEWCVNKYPALLSCGKQTSTETGG